MNQIATSTRKKLLIFFVVLFIISGVFLILYSNGYRIDLKSLKIEKTGSLYVKFIPTNSHIYLNNKFKKSSGIITRTGILINNLIPKNYRLEIKKPNYYTYYKNVKIRPSEVTKLLNIIILPKKTEIWKSYSGILGNKLLDISSNGTSAITYSEKETKKNFYICTLLKISSCKNLTSKIQTLIKESPKKIYYYPSGQNKFIVTTKNGIYRINILNDSSRKIASGKFKYIDIEKNNLYAIGDYSKQSTKNNPNNASSIIIYDIMLGKIIENIKTPFTTDAIKSIKSNGSDYILIILNSGDLFMFNISSSKLKMIDSNVSFASFSPNNSKIIYKTKDKGVLLYMLENDISSLKAKSGDVIKIWLNKANDIKNIKWFDEYHIITTYDDVIYFSEIDYRANNNQYKLFKISKNENTIYIPNIKTEFKKSSSTIEAYKIIITK